MYYEVTVSGWVSGQGWEYRDTVVEHGIITSMDDMDLEGYLRETYGGEMESIAAADETQDILYRVLTWDTLEDRQDGKRGKKEQAIWLHDFAVEDTAG